MECRDGCACCCIYLSISSPMPLHPNGKKAGERCLHLTDDLKCSIYNDPRRPKVCDGYKPDPLFCGANPHEAKQILSELACLT
ncbi:MAG: hypothetical protein RBR35_13810 [Salinivirgaceae bacterium]|nr:hypothetical protein [Salinivirgaceae bacterium]